MRVCELAVVAAVFFLGLAGASPPAAEQIGTTVPVMATSRACEWRSDCVGVVERHPRLSWMLAGSGRSLGQTAYRLLTATHPDRLAPGHADPAVLHLPPAPQDRKVFAVTKPVKRAVLHAAALGLLAWPLDGTRVGDHWFEPGWNDSRRRVPALTVAGHEANAAVVEAAPDSDVFRLTEPAREPVSGDAVIRAPAGGSEIVITTTSRVAGAIHSLTWNGMEFIDSHDHGRQLQSASNFDVDGTFFNETFNPTEAGCERDMAGPTSTSRLLWLAAGERGLSTVSRMAFWLRPGQESGGQPAKNTTALSDHLLQKHVSIGAPDLPLPARDHAIRHDVVFHVPAGERHTRGTFEALTGYMPSVFRRFDSLQPDGSLAPLSDGPGEQPLTLIVSTPDGGHAMGAWSPDTCHTTDRPPSYGRFWFEHARVSKWNCVFREAAAAGEHLDPGPYRYRIWVAVGTREQVRETLCMLRSAETRTDSR